MYILFLVWKWIGEKFDIKWMYLLCFIFVDTAFLLCGAELQIHGLGHIIHFSNQGYLTQREMFQFQKLYRIDCLREQCITMLICSQNIQSFQFCAWLLYNKSWNFSGLYPMKGKIDLQENKKIKIYNEMSVTLHGF